MANGRARMAKAPGMIMPTARSIGWAKVSRAAPPMTAARADGAGTASISAYVHRQREALSGFLAFKRRYETVLIPLNSAIGVILTFHLFFPGGVAAYPIGALATYLLTLLSCVAAVRSENRKSFLWPLRDLQALLDEYREGPEPSVVEPGGREDY